MAIDVTNHLPKGLISIDECCAVLKVSRRTLDSYFRKGLERVNIGRKVYTDAAAIQRFARGSNPSQPRFAREVTEDERAAHQELRELGV